MARGAWIGLPGAVRAHGADRWSRQTGASPRRSGFAWARVLWASLAIVPVLGAPALHADGGRSPADTLGISWVEVEGGTLTGGGGGSRPPVALDRFLISATEVTFDQYDAFCAATGRPKPDDNGWGRGSRPVLNVSCDDATAFCRWLSGITGKAVRLPNEAEWEYAARGGRRSKGYAYSGGNDKNAVSWNAGNSGGRTHPVGTKQANELGLLDMSGNLWEWCVDWPDTRPGEARAPGGDTKRVLRGNSFDNPGSAEAYRLALRLDGDSRHINIGFRIARSE